jgi:hypothetical protein
LKEKNRSGKTNGIHFGLHVAGLKWTPLSLEICEQTVIGLLQSFYLCSKRASRSGLGRNRSQAAPGLNLQGMEDPRARQASLP